MQNLLYYCSFGVWRLFNPYKVKTKFNLSNKPMISPLTINLTLPENYAHELLAILNTLSCVYSSTLNWPPFQTHLLSAGQITYASLATGQ